MADVEKGVGRGRGRYSAAGVGLDVESRLAAIEDYLSDQIDAGRLPEPDVEEVEEEAPA